MARKRIGVDPKAAAGFYDVPSGSMGSKTEKKAIGVYLSQDQIDQLDKIVEDTQIRRGELLRFSVELFLQLYSTGEIKTESELISKKKLTLSK